MNRRHASRLLLTGLLSPALAACAGPGWASAPIAIGLIAPLSGPVYTSGLAVYRGMLLAVDEINRAGGIAGRPLEIVPADIPNDPPAGVAALRSLAAERSVVAVFGGIFSPVMVGLLPAVHTLRIPMLSVWGSMTAITENQRQPNYAFRVGVNDRYAAEFLARYVTEVLGLRLPSILADTSAWGDSNVASLRAWFEDRDLPLGAVARFAQGEHDLSIPVQAARDSGADGIILVGNAPEGGAAARAMATSGWRVPVVGHWGLSGGPFPQLAGVGNAQGVFTLQSFSFEGDYPRAPAVADAYRTMFKQSPGTPIAAPSGVANAYDGVHLLAQALQRAGSTEGPAVRDALEHLPPYDGLIKRYDPAFSATSHDALATDDYLMAMWDGGLLVPAPQSRLP